MEVRKADTLLSLDELNMPSRAKTYFIKKFNGSLDRIILEGRNISHRDISYQKMEKNSKSALELIKALDEAGFIRHDINRASFRIANLYHAIFGNKISVAMFAGFDEGHPTTNTNWRERNEMYESFQNPTNEQIEAVKQSLKVRLTEREYMVVACRFGFEGNKTYTLEQTSQQLNITREHVLQIEAKALRKLRHSNTLPAFIQSSDEQRAEIPEIIHELEKLRKNPIFRQEAYLMHRLREIAKEPFSRAEEAKAYLSSGVLDFSDIGQLDLSVRTYNCLRRADINTIADIIRLPKGKWLEIRNIASHGLEEIENKIHEIGYTDFSILS